uniref:Uncharacterized protein n=1 Tax=Rousettus aegyptiacus TaxID=9407 RepID=A0A7J8H2B6_ROUAE|nr:hypothetical protein HJG63_011322 [Rousettus aegyptiacus]
MSRRPELEKPWPIDKVQVHWRACQTFNSEPTYPSHFFSKVSHSPASPHAPVSRIFHVLSNLPATLSASVSKAHLSYLFLWETLFILRELPQDLHQINPFCTFPSRILNCLVQNIDCRVKQDWILARICYFLAR